MKTIELKIKGMTCPTCSAAVERITDELPGIKSKYVNHVLDMGRFEFDETIIAEQEIIDKINEGHYKVISPDGKVKEVKVTIPSCPVCNHPGQTVPNTVFKANVKKDSVGKINLNTKNYICLNPECNTVYYNEQGLNVEVPELKREVWYKKSSKNKIICYCNNITREDIKNAITNHNLSTWEDIVLHYRKKAVERCDVLNPTGYCCRETFNKVVNKFKNN